MRTVDIKEQEIFPQAVEMESTVARSGFVRRACGDNINLRERIEELLRLHEKGGFIIDREIGLNTVGEVTTDVEGMANLSCIARTSLAGRYLS